MILHLKMALTYGMPCPRAEINVAVQKAHLETAHFRKYKATTQEMVKSLKLRETLPILLAAKPK